MFQGNPEKLRDLIKCPCALDYVTNLTETFINLLFNELFVMD